MSKTDVQLQPCDVELTEIDISVVVPFYNAEKYIEKCAEALLTQSYPTTRYEIIMVDNNSTDRSVDLIKKYPRIKLLSQQKQGSYAARNQGVAASKGTILAFTDADCVPSSDWLQKTRAALHTIGTKRASGVVPSVRTTSVPSRTKESSSCRFV